MGLLLGLLDLVKEGELFSICFLFKNMRGKSKKKMKWKRENFDI